MRYPDNVIKLAEIMARHGYRAYAVGGCVRDSIMGREPCDWDMTTDASPEKMMEVFEQESVRTVPTGLKHGTVTVLLGGEAYEMTTFRIDGSYTDSRHPDKVTFTRDIEGDLARRDFTVNAMALDPLCDTCGRQTCGWQEKSNENNEIIDLFGGREDIKNKVIRAVGKPERRFFEDALRIMRAVRFAAVLGFEIEAKTKKAACELAHGLLKVSAERKKIELEKTLMSDGADYGMGLVFELGLAKYIHPELKLPEFSLSRLPRRFETRMAALFWNGKNPPDSLPELASLKLSRVESTNIKSLCDKGKFNPESSEKNARRMLSVYGELAVDAAKLYGQEALAELIEQQAIYNPCVKISQLDIKGTDLISAGVEPRNIGDIMSHLLDAVIDEPSLNEKEKLLKLVIGFPIS